MFHKEKKNDGKPLTACFHSDGPQIKIMKTQTSIEKEKLGRGRNRNVRRERKKNKRRETSMSHKIWKHFEGTDHHSQRH